MAKVVKDFGGTSESLDAATKEPLIAAVSRVHYIDSLTILITLTMLIA
ncbi:hypothetical protein [Vibrio sp. CB1-14]|jgi:hypothetical protein|uniref:Uncharacterized protein n=1 Tax=Vibrio chaetopteri TaxID=3016528 RepID=A0AAU8BKY7_9VIBR